MAKKKRKSQSNPKINIRETLLNGLIDLIVGMLLTAFGFLLEYLKK